MHTIPEGEFGFCEIRLSSLFLLGMFAKFIYYTTVNIGTLNLKFALLLCMVSTHKMIVKVCGWIVYQLVQVVFEGYRFDSLVIDL